MEAEVDESGACVYAFVLSILSLLCQVLVSVVPALAGWLSPRFLLMKEYLHTCGRRR